MNRTILLVDDEPNILSALTRLLRPAGYTILRATSGDEGLKLLAQNEVGVIIADQRMPEMNGVEFLRKAHELHPNSMRIVLSGYTELNSVTDAINQGAIYKFITKPWEDDFLRAQIEEAFQHYEMKQENARLTAELKVANKELEQRVQEKTNELTLNRKILDSAKAVLLATLHKIPSMPTAVQDIISSFDNADIEIHELAEKISRDQNLSAHILRLANSSFYGLPRQVGSIPHAVVVLGFNAVRSLALAAGIAGMFPAKSGSFPWRDYWKRSMAAGVIARALAKCLNLNPDNAFTAGLFHDIGLAALAFGAPQQLAEAQAAAAEGGDLLAMERLLLGFDHAVLGGEVAKYWRFPLDIEQAIRHHHDTESNVPLVLITQAASRLATAMIHDLELDMEACLPQSLCSALGLDAEQIRHCIPTKEEIMSACASLMPT